MFIFKRHAVFPQVAHHKSTKCVIICYLYYLFIPFPIGYFESLGLNTAAVIWFAPIPNIRNYSKYQKGTWGKGMYHTS